MRKRRNQRLFSGITVAVLIAGIAVLAEPNPAFAQDSCWWYLAACENQCSWVCASQGGFCGGGWSDCYGNCWYYCNYPTDCCELWCWFNPWACDCDGKPLCWY